MKTLSNITVGLLVAAFVIPAFNGCKRGEEDPSISLKSRNKRVTGTWTLKSYDNSWTTSTTVNTSNDVNDDTYTSTYTTSSSSKYDGNNQTTTWAGNYSSLDKSQELDLSNFKYDDREETWDSSSTSNSLTSYVFTLALYTDNTYEATTTSGNASGSSNWDWDFDIESPNGDSDGDDDGDNSWSTTGTSVSIQQGAWYWEDDTKKGKIFINAGMVKGKVVRLTSKEMWVEAQYGALRSGDQSNGYDGEETSGVGSSTVVLTIDLPEYDDNNPGDVDEGDQITITSWNNTASEGMWVFEKTDKNSKRHKATSTQ
ncbi:MAG: hypothetical protein COA57_13045 [Flavobacteriales bacterium]|nr:MAG: hypothetical protein COA57_13045 [Flavobacteriales bacterium]